MSSPDRTLGFVLLFTDLTERKAAEAARRKFQESILQAHRTLKGRIDSKADLALENLMSSVVENAQLAAMEIADGLDTARMPAMLESVRTSVARTAEVLASALDRSGKIAKLNPFFRAVGIHIGGLKMASAVIFRTRLRQRQCLRMNACTVIEGSRQRPPALSPCRTIGFCSRGSMGFIALSKPSWKPQRPKSRSASTSWISHDRLQSTAICARSGLTRKTSEPANLQPDFHPR